MKKTTAITVILLVTLILSACNAQEAINPSETPVPSAVPELSAAPAPTDEAAYEPIDNSQTGVGVIIQEYIGDNIAEILMITYDGSQKAFEEYGGKNPEIELVNNLIKAGPLEIYREFEDAGTGDIEIRSYPFVDDEFVQIVTSCIVFPEERPDLYTRLWSYNFSKKENAYIGVDEMLIESNLTQETLFQRVKAQFKPSNENEKLLEATATGFLINREHAEPVTQFLLEVTCEMESDPYKSFYMYTPENDELERLDPGCLFNPEAYDMVIMEPPLAYASPEMGWPQPSPLRVSMDVSGFEELTPESEYMLDGQLYVRLDALESVEYDETAVLERIRELEDSDIRVQSIEPSEEHGDRLTYPVWLVIYEKGLNEDTVLCTDLYIQTDGNDYRVHTSVSVDHAKDYHDELYKRLAAVTLEDASE